MRFLWYDFFLYGTTADLVFGKLYFLREDPLSATLLAFGTYFIGFAARPVGAALFGRYGDRIGRKATLIATLLCVGTEVSTSLRGSPSRLEVQLDLYSVGGHLWPQAAAPFLHSRLCAVEPKLSPAVVERSPEKTSVVVEFVVPNGARTREDKE